MRIARILTAAILVAGSLSMSTPAAASHVACSATVTGYATAPNGGLFATAVVAVGVVEVNCFMDVLATPPGDYLEGWSLLIETDITDDDGLQFVCGSSNTVPAVGPAAVSVFAQTCVIGTDSPDYRSTLYLRTAWTAFGPDWSESDSRVATLVRVP